MVKIDNKEIYHKMDPRKLEKIQIYPSKQHCGYNKLSNQMPKLTKTIMSPLTTMPPKKLMISPHNGVTMKPNSPQQANMNMKAEQQYIERPPIMTNNVMQISAIKNNFAVKTLMSSPVPQTIAVQPKVEAKIVDRVKDAAAGYRSEKISLDAVHPYITCSLCEGYLIEATTIVECLHTYCHSCLMKHLTTEKVCPQCKMSINKSKTNIKYDATIQSIVFKLVPGLYQKELLKRRAFYRQHPEQAKLATPEERGDDTEHLILSPLDPISLSLDYAEKETLKGMETDESIKNLLQPKYLNCPAIFKVEHLKKFIVSKFLINSSRFNVEISYKVKTIVLPEHYTLMDVAYIYTWKKEAPMPFFFRIIAKNSKCDELPEVALRRSPTTTLPNATDETLTKKKSVSFKEDVEDIDKKAEAKVVSKSNENSRKSSDYPPNAPRIETIKLKLDVSNNNVSIIKNTGDSTPRPEIKHKHKKEKKHKSENPLPKYSIASAKPQPKKDEYEFDDEIDQQKLGFLNTFQLTAKKVLNEKVSAKSDCTLPSTINRNNLSQKQTESSINKRKSKEPVKAAPKKYKFHEMQSVGEGNKFLFTKTGDGHEITFDMSPKPLGSKPPLSKVKSDIMMAQQRADAKAMKEMNSKAEVKAADVERNQRNVPIKPKKLPMLLPKQPSPLPIPVTPSAVSPTAFVIKKPETKKDFSSGEISVTKINDQNPNLRVYGPKSPTKTPVKEQPMQQFKSPDGFAQPLPPKAKSNSLMPAPSQILKPYGHQMKMPKNIPDNLQTVKLNNEMYHHGCRTPFYVPSSPSYTPNFDAKPQFKYANPNAYASFMQSMFCAPTAGKISPPISTKQSNDNARKRPSTDSSSSVPSKRKSPSPTKPVETDSKAISILNKINFPSSLSVTLTNEQEENKKEQLRSQKQSIVNNNIEIIKISEEKELKAAKNAALNDKKASDKKSVEGKKLSPIMPALVPHPSSMPPTPKIMLDSTESFQRAFLESLNSLAAGKQNVEKSQSRKKEAGKSSAAETSGKDDKDKIVTEIKTEDGEPIPLVVKNLSKHSERSTKRKSLSPPPSKTFGKALNVAKSLTPPPFIQDPSMLIPNAQAIQFNMMMNALNQAAKAPYASYEYATIQRTMLETLRQNNAFLAMHQQLQHQQQIQKNPSSSSSASSPSSKH